MLSGLETVNIKNTVTQSVATRFSHYKDLSFIFTSQSPYLTDYKISSLRLELDQYTLRKQFDSGSIVIRINQR